MTGWIKSVNVTFKCQRRICLFLNLSDVLYSKLRNKTVCLWERWRSRLAFPWLALPCSTVHEAWSLFSYAWKGRSQCIAQSWKHLWMGSARVATKRSVAGEKVEKQTFCWFVRWCMGLEMRLLSSVASGNPKSSLLASIVCLPMPSKSTDKKSNAYSTEESFCHHLLSLSYHSKLFYDKNLKICQYFLNLLSFQFYMTFTTQKKIFWIFWAPLTCISFLFK